jgi:hypothetical protein
VEGTTVKKLAKNLKVSAHDLLRDLLEAGVRVESIDSVVSSREQLALISSLNRKKSEATSSGEVSVDDLASAGDLQALNSLLTRAMAERSIQSLIREQNLRVVVDLVLAKTEPDSQLFASAVLGRLAAVARGREEIVFERADQVFSIEPPSLEVLGDGEEKQYASELLAYVTADWVSQYSFRESLAIDTADNARRELLFANLKRSNSLAAWIEGATSVATELDQLATPDQRARRVKRISAVMQEIAERWKGDVGEQIGEHLARFATAILPARVLSADDQAAIYETLNSIVAMLARAIERQFSNALYADTFDVLVRLRKAMGLGPWLRFLEVSSSIEEVRAVLLEASLVLARQNKTDSKMMLALQSCYATKQQAASAVARRFKLAPDVDPEIAKWWQGGRTKSTNSQDTEHKIGNSEDSQIGILLMEVESNRDAMEKLGRAVVPMLDISDPVLASTVKKAVDGFEMVAQTARRLARMRKLTQLDQRGERLEYNPLEHEMLGGHRAGVRTVKVVRDGVQKDFGGKIKTLVKPWVEPEE